MERTRGVLALQLLMNGLNVALAFLFVLGLGRGVAGAATATLIAEWAGLGLGLWLCRSAFAGNQWRDWPRVFDPARLRRMAAVNRDILIRSVVLQASFTSFLFFGAGLGDVTLAANQVLLQFLEHHRLRARRLRLRRRGAGRPDPRPARPRRAAPRGDPHLGMGRRHRAGDGRGADRLRSRA